MRSKHYDYRLSPRAKQDLEEIWLYTLHHWSVQQADGYVSDLLVACEELAKGHRVGVSAEYVREGYMKYLSASHCIYYIASQQYFDIIRILHQNRDISSLLQIESSHE